MSSVLLARMSCHWWCAQFPPERQVCRYASWSELRDEDARIADDHQRQAAEAQIAELERSKALAAESIDSFSREQVIRRQLSRVLEDPAKYEDAVTTLAAAWNDDHQATYEAAYSEGSENA